MGRSPFLPLLLGPLLLGAAASEQALANIKVEYQRAHSCDYFKAPFVSDVGLYKDEKVAKNCTPSYLPEFIRIEVAKRA